jgi:hypothetical protein
MRNEDKQNIKAGNGTQTTGMKRLVHLRKRRDKRPAGPRGLRNRELSLVLQTS